MNDCTHHWTTTSECPMCLRAEIERLQERLNCIRKLLQDNAPRTVFIHDDDDCGERGCCGVESYKPHAPGCWYEECKKLVRWTQVPLFFTPKE